MSYKVRGCVDCIAVFIADNDGMRGGRGTRDERKSDDDSGLGEHHSCEDNLDLPQREECGGKVIL